MARIDANQTVTAADGAELATDVYLPDRLPAPAVITRTPYGRHALAANGIGWARNGIAFVAQDVRGRYGSTGTWAPYRREDVDGRALAAWVHRQPWCDGNLIVAGASYGSHTAWATALSSPDLIRGVISEVPAAGLAQANTDPAGIVRLAEYAGWWTEHADARVSRTGLTARMLAADPDLLRHLPVADLGRLLWARLPRWWKAIAPHLPAVSRLGHADATAPHDDTARQDAAADDGTGTGTEAEAGAGAGAGHVSDDALASCPLPTLHIGGWYDLFLPQTLQQWETAGRAHTPRPTRGLVIGPWAHELSTPTSHSAGGYDHGPASQLRLGPLQVTWIHDLLAGRDMSMTKVFLVGASRWLDRWPASTGILRLHATADRSLTPTAPPHHGEHTFTYDPLDPHPSVPAGRDRAHLDDRSDAVIFRGAPLPAPTTLTGAPTVRLAARGEAPSADWIVRLIRRLPDGRALEISTGVATTPGPGSDTPTVLRIPLGATGLRLKPGDRLELHIAGSDFPRLARNLNTGPDRYTSTATRIATQTIHTGPAHGSWVDLPVTEHP